MFTNCRFGMMAWPLILISFPPAERDERPQRLDDRRGRAPAVYIAKFYWWETG